MAVMLSDLLRNLTFNRSAHCTQVSDQCPLGLLLTSFLDFVILPYLNAISMDFYAVKCLIYIYFV